MTTEIRMPELAADMTEADLLTWLVKPGDRVEAGDLLVELETDKSTVEYESPLSGTLVEIRVAEGTNSVPVGTVLAIIAEDGSGEPATEKPSEPPPEPVAEVRRGDAATAPRDERTGTKPATALARRLALQDGVDLDRIPGSGRGGRVLKADVEAARRQGPSTQARAAEAEIPARPEGAEAEGPTTVPHSRMRRAIATRLTRSKQTVPHFYLHVDCEIDRLLEARRRLNAGGEHISVNDFVVRAVAQALMEVPDANVSWTEEALVRHAQADVSVAVATEGGLVTPVVREANRKQLAALSSEIRDLAARARDGKLLPAEYQGGSLTVSNLGMYGIDSVYPILNPPQSCILGVGAGTQRAVARDGELTIATVMTCTLSADHRAVDGAVAAQLLVAFKRRIETPLDMLL